MYLQRKTKNYEKSLKNLELAGRIKPSVFDNLEIVINTLSSGRKLNTRHRDHSLHGEYVGYRECHIQSDLLLIYKIEKDLLILLLTDIGSHSYLFG